MISCRVCSADFTRRRDVGSVLELERRWIFFSDTIRFDLDGMRDSGFGFLAFFRTRISILGTCFLVTVLPLVILLSFCQSLSFVVCCETKELHIDLEFG